jgi:hypothetical protein
MTLKELTRRLILILEMYICENLLAPLALWNVKPIPLG